MEKSTTEDLEALKKEIERALREKMNDPEFQRRNTRRAADWTAMYARMRGKPVELAVFREKLVHEARMQAEIHLADVRSPAARLAVSGRLWDAFPPHLKANHPGDEAWGFAAFHEAIWSTQYPSLEERAKSFPRLEVSTEPSGSEIAMYVEAPGPSRFDLSQFDLSTRAGRKALLHACKAEAKARDVKITNDKLGAVVQKGSRSPETIIEKWQGCHPRYEKYHDTIIKILQNWSHHFKP